MSEPCDKAGEEAPPQGEQRARLSFAEVMAARAQQKPPIGSGGRLRVVPEKRWGDHYVYEFILELDDLRYFANATERALPLLEKYRDWVGDFGAAVNEIGEALPGWYAIHELNRRCEYIAAVPAGFDWWGTEPEWFDYMLINAGESLERSPLAKPFVGLFQQLVRWVVWYISEEYLTFGRAVPVIDEPKFNHFMAVARRFKELEASLGVVLVSTQAEYARATNRGPKYSNLMRREEQRGAIRIMGLEDGMYHYEVVDVEKGRKIKARIEQERKKKG